MLLVGYTADYWIAKNSWGVDFGDNGFIYVTRDRSQNCRIGSAVHEMGEFVLHVGRWLGGMMLLAMLLG